MQRVCVQWYVCVYVKNGEASIMMYVLKSKHWQHNQHRPWESVIIYTHKFKQITHIMRNTSQWVTHRHAHRHTHTHTSMGAYLSLSTLLKPGRMCLKLELRSSLGWLLVRLIEPFNLRLRNPWIERKTEIEKERETDYKRDIALSLSLSISIRVWGRQMK